MKQPIKILSSNLIPKEQSVLLSQSSGAEVILKFTAAETFDTLIIKNTNITSATVAYKQEEGDPYTTLASFTIDSLQGICFTLPQTAAKIVKLSFTSGGAACYASSLQLCRALAVLDDVLSTVSFMPYSKGGHHYLADGSLINWVEYVKQTCTLRLDNVKQGTKNILSAILKNNNFLTYIFYGNFDLSLSGEFALTKPPAVTLDRKTALYQIDLSLSER